MPTVKNVGEPCAGEPHARIDVAAGGNQTSRAHTAARPRRLPPTRPLPQWRDVTFADPDSRTLNIADGVSLEQRAFRGFLMRRGWKVPYLGPFFTTPEATRELTRGGPVAVLYLEPGTDDEGRVTLGHLGFESVQGRKLDARALPQALVSEAARDVLGAVKAGA